ncbi:MAG: TonB-dependent receptor [Bryobacteraceae bacterium]|nr:TonB-dependent receptor [Bryobacteraceae bacterium]
MSSLRCRRLLPVLVAFSIGIALPAAGRDGNPAAGRASGRLEGTVTDPQGKAVPNAEVRLSGRSGGIRRETRTDDEGRFSIDRLAAGDYDLTAESLGFHAVSRSVELGADETVSAELHFSQVAGQSVSMVISARALEPSVDMRNAEVFNKTLFTRDDQMLQQMDAGINAGQHEGGGKSLEIRRFGFNLDHGGVNGGLKVMLDDVQQNQGTQGHGQGYLGALKALSPELIGEVNIINGPFSAEYGDFSGLGVVQIRQRESLPDELTARFQGGNFDTWRGFLAYSPDVQHVDSYLAYEGAYTDGPFLNPGRYRRDNVNGNYSTTLPDGQKLGFRFLYGRNDFYSSGQIPLDQVAAGLLDRFGYIDPSDGGKVWLGTASTYYIKSFANGDVLRADGFVNRNLFDLFSNFTFFLTDPVHGDGIQQHDSRLTEGATAQYTHSDHLGPVTALLTAGANYHDDQINVGLYPRLGRDPLGVTTRADARITNGAGYIQESLSLLNGCLILTGGLRLDAFRWDVKDRVNPLAGGVEQAGRWQPKASLAFTPFRKLPLTLYTNYGRGINSVDARAVVQRPDQPRVATTDFYQAGASSHFGRLSFSADAFLIDHSNEMVYIPDDGSFEFKGPSRSYGYEAKTSIELTHHLSLNGGLTKIGNSFYRGGDHRVYVDSAPHLTANAALTLSAWRGWSASLRLRAINHYRLDGDDPSIVATGSTIWDLSLTRQLHHGVELSLSCDNLLDKSYYETQNYFVSRISPDAPAVARIHATPGYPFAAVVGLTYRLKGKH